MISQITNNIVASTKFFKKNLGSNLQKKYPILNRYYFSVYNIKRIQKVKAKNPQQLSKICDKKSNYKLRPRIINHLYANKNDGTNDMQKSQNMTDMAKFNEINRQIKEAVTLKQIFYMYDSQSKNMQPLQHAIVFDKMVDLKIINQISLVKQTQRHISQKQDQNFQQNNNPCENQKNFQEVIQNVIKNASQLSLETLAQIMLCFCRLQFHQLKNSSARRLLNAILIQFNNKQNVQATQVSRFIKLIIEINSLKDRIKTVQMVQYHLCQEAIKKLVAFVTTKLINCRTSSLCQLVELCKQNTKIGNRTFLKQIINQLLKRHKDKLQLRTLLTLQTAIFRQPKLLNNILKIMQQQKIPLHNMFIKIQSYITKNLQQHLKNPNLNTRLVVNHIKNLRTLQLKQIASINQIIFQMGITGRHKKTQKEVNQVDLDPSFNIIMQHMESIARALYQIYQKYLLQTYSGAEQKEATISWVNRNQSFTSEFFQLIKQKNKTSNFALTDSEGTNNTQKLDTTNFALERNMKGLINLLIRFYTQLNFDTQLAVLLYVVENNHYKRRHIAQIFVQKLLEVEISNISASNSLRLLQLFLIDQFKQFFTMHNQGFKWISHLFKQVFLKYHHLANEKANLISRVLVTDKKYLQLFIKRYIKFSTENRFFNQNDVLFIKKFRKRVFMKVARVRNAFLDHQYLDIDENYEGGSSWKLRQKIYRKINNCICWFQLIMKIFGNINRQMMKEGSCQKSENPHKNLKQLPLFQQILKNFQEQLRFIIFEELITYQNIQKIIYIEDQLDHRMNIPVINCQRQKIQKAKVTQNAGTKKAPIQYLQIN